MRNSHTGKHLLYQSKGKMDAVSIYLSSEQLRQCSSTIISDYRHNSNQFSYYIPLLYQWYISLLMQML